METASLIASIVSITLGGIAIWLSIHFYTQGKGTETDVKVALSGIQAQTNALQSLHTRTLDRFTKHFTTPRDDGSQIADLFSSTIKELPALMGQLQPPQPSADAEALRQEIFMAYIALWNYTAMTNVWAGFSLPPADQFDESKPYDIWVKSVVDRSAADFAYMTTVLGNLRPEDITSSPYFHLYQEVETRLRDLVGDTAQQFSRRAQDA